MNKYIGHPSQLYSVQEYTLKGGRADGMRMLRLQNGMGLDFEISLDRAGDIVKLNFKGDNISYISPCGYVSPKYYEKEGKGFLKSFTAGFLTTCGLTNVGPECVDEGIHYPMHGTISNTPCDEVNYFIDDEKITVRLIVRDCALFFHKLVLVREYVCPLNENAIYIKDKIINQGSLDTPVQFMYHINIGYPLLSENSKVCIPSKSFVPRDEDAKAGMENHLVMEKPQKGYREKCYYHTFETDAEVSVSNPDIKKKVSISFNACELPSFTQWKMMGEQEYVLGLEPGNCNPEGRDVYNRHGKLEFLKPCEEKICKLKVSFEETK